MGVGRDSQPAAKRAVAIALINAIGNASSIYSTWLWPDKDAPRYVPGFVTTTTWLGVISISTVAAAYFLDKFPVQRASYLDAMSAELQARRDAGAMPPRV